MQGKTNVHLIGVVLIAVSLVGAFWAFGFAEKLFVKKIHSDEIRESDLLISNISSDQMAHADMSSELGLPRESSAITNNDITITPRSPPPQKSEKSRLTELESKEFRLELRGTAMVSPSTISKDAILSIKMRSVPGTNLETFTVSEARLILENTAMQLKLVAVKIMNYDVVMTIASGGVGEYTISAKIDEKIVSDNNNKQNVLMQDQLFYLVNKDIPYKLTLSGTLSS